MADSVLGEDRMPRSSRAWRADLRKAARLYRAMYLRHPWMLAVSGFRMLYGTNLLRGYEFTLSAIDGLGLDIDEMVVLWVNFEEYRRRANFTLSATTLSQIIEAELGISVELET